MSYPARVTTLEEALIVAERMLARRSKEMVSDGIVLARWIKTIAETGCWPIPKIESFSSGTSVEEIRKSIDAHFPKAPEK